MKIDVYLGFFSGHNTLICPTKVKAKVKIHNNFLGKLANSRWSGDPHTLRTTALALSYSVFEYCSPVWDRSSHAKKVDPELNNTCRIITRTLKPTPLTLVYKLSGKDPSTTHSEFQAMTEKQQTRAGLKAPTPQAYRDKGKT